MERSAPARGHKRAASLMQDQQQVANLVRQEVAVGIEQALRMIGGPAQDRRPAGAGRQQLIDVFPELDAMAAPIQLQSQVLINPQDIQKLKGCIVSAELAVNAALVAQ